MTIMKIKKLLTLSLILASGLTLTSCNILDLLGVGTSEEPLNIELGEYAGQRITFDQVNRASEIITLKSEGKQNLLVLPVCFKDYEMEKLGLEEEIVLKNLNNNFFGEANQTGWESVSSYYKKSSYGKLEISGEVGNVYTLDKTLKQVLNLSGSTYFDPSYYVVEQACENFKNNYQGDISKFDQDKDGYLDAVWVVYLNPYLDDESLEVYKRFDSSFYNSSFVDDAMNLLWAYTYWDYDSKANVKSPNPFVYGFASYNFLWDQPYYDENKVRLVDPHTFIHETGHILGLDDYYSYDYEDVPPSPTGAIDMMDNNVGDHNAYSKYLMNWVKPKIIKEAGTYSIKPFESSGDCLLIPSKLESFNDSPFDEYLMIEYYTPTGLNELDSHQKYENDIILPSQNGVKIYHVDSRLVKLKYSYILQDYQVKGYTDYYVNNEDEYCRIGANNTSMYSVTDDTLITLLSAYKNGEKGYYYQDRNNLSAEYKDLFTNTGLTSFKFNSSDELPYEISFEDMDDNGVNVVIKLKETNL